MEDVNKRAQELQAQVQQLQTKLHEVHSTDVNTLRRSFRSISQHINALKHEATALETRVKSLEPELYPPEYIAEQVAQVGVVTATTYGACKLLQDVPLAPRARAWLRSSVVMVAFVLIGWRLAAGSVARFAKALREHQARRRQLLQEWEALKQRIDMLLALTQTAGPYLAGASPLSSSGSSSRERLAGAAAAGTQQQQAVGEAAAAGAGTSSMEAGGGVAGRNGDFVVLDLPRVDSCPSAMSGTVSPAVMVDMPQARSARTSSGGGSSGSGSGGPPPSTTPAAPDSAAAGASSSDTPQVGDTSSAAATTAAGSGGAASQGTGSTAPAAAAALSMPSNAFSSGWGGMVARPTGAVHSPTRAGTQPATAGLESAASAESDADWVQAGSSQAPRQQQQQPQEQQPATVGGAHSSSRPPSPARTSPSMSDAVLLDADDSD